MALGSTQPLTEMTTRNISWGKGGRCVRLTTLPPSCAVVMKSGNLNFLEPSGPLHACNGTALPFLPLDMSPHIDSVTATAVVSTVSFCWYIFSPLFYYTFHVSLFIHKHSSTNWCTIFPQLYSEMFNAIYIQCVVLFSPTHRLTSAYIKYLGLRSERESGSRNTTSPLAAMI